MPAAQVSGHVFLEVQVVDDNGLGLLGCGARGIQCRRRRRVARLQGQNHALAIGRPREAIDVIGDMGECARLAAAPVEQHHLALLGIGGLRQVRQVAAVRAPARRGDAARRIGQLHVLLAIPAHHPDRAADFVGVAIAGGHEIGDPLPVGRQPRLANALHAVDVVGSQRALRGRCFGGQRACGRR